MEQSAGDWRDGIVCAGLRLDLMAVMPVCERAAELLVAEVIVPDELGDLSFPENSRGRVWEGAKADREFRTSAGCKVAEFGGSDRRRRCEGGFFDAGLLPGRHEAWEIFGIGEEGED